MNQLSSLNSTGRRGLGTFVIAAVLYAASVALAAAADTNAPAAKAAAPKVAQAKTAQAKTEAVKAKKPQKAKLTGAELYAINCNRCHPERYPTEWNSAQWSTILLHMRVRANLPAEQARAILKFMQEDSGK